MKKVIIGFSALMVLTFFIIFAVNALNSSKEVTKTNTEVTQNISPGPSVAACPGYSCPKMAACNPADCSKVCKYDPANCKGKCDPANCKGKCDPAACKDAKCDPAACMTKCSGASAMTSAPMDCSRKAIAEK